MIRSILPHMLVALICVSAGAHKSAQSHAHSHSIPHADGAAVSAQAAYQRQDTWYEFMLKQFNPDNVDYGRWLEERRHEFIEARIKNRYFSYSLFVSLALLLVSAICVKQWIDHRRSMSITAEMMADIYNQDAYSRQVAHEAIDRYNRHIERCNRAIEAAENGFAGAENNEVGQLKTELMRVAEERDRAIRDRDLAREDLRRKGAILADMSVRLDAFTNKSGPAPVNKTTSEVRGADAHLMNHISNLQEQLYAERKNNRRLRGG